MSAPLPLSDGQHELQNTDTGGGIGYDGVQHPLWAYALVCLFRPLLLEAPIKNQQDRRIAHTNIVGTMRLVCTSKLKIYYLEL